MTVGSENLTSSSAAAVEIPADLLALAKRTDGEINAPAPGTPEAEELERARKLEEQAAAIPLERELAGIFAMAGTAIGHWLPRVGQVMTRPDPGGKSAADHLGDALAPVARKYGLDRFLEGFAWRVELNALMVAGPIALALVQAARLDIADLKRQAAPAGAAPIGEAELRDRARAAAAEKIAEASGSSSPATGPMLQPITRQELPQ